MSTTEPQRSTRATIRPRERDAIVQALRAGVVPRVGQQHIQVGRVEEVGSCSRTSTGSPTAAPAVRFVIGEYGAGKTFFLHLVRSIALEKKLVTAHADLTPGPAPARHRRPGPRPVRRADAQHRHPRQARRRRAGQRRRAVRRRTAAQRGARAGRQPGRGHRGAGWRDLSEMTSAATTSPRSSPRTGAGYDTGNEQLKTDAVRWLRGEFATRTDARAALGVRTIVDDANFYDQLKLLARFVRLAGFGGLLVVPRRDGQPLQARATPQARNANYEQILRIVNDSLQGSADGLGFVFGGTPEFLLDTRRGLYSYAALRRAWPRTRSPRRPGRLLRARCCAWPT